METVKFRETRIIRYLLQAEPSRQGSWGAQGGRCQEAMTIQGPTPRHVTSITILSSTSINSTRWF